MHWPTPSMGPAAAERLRQRYRIVMVDEFQDTDPIQWEILRRAFHRHTTLILIGDPKQAIYAFRGADVFSYLDAVQQADRSGASPSIGAVTGRWSMRLMCCWVTPLSVTSESWSARSLPNISSGG